MKISVVIPAYNEEKSIAQTISRVQNAVKGAEIIVVDDGSKDGTYEEARRSGAIAVKHEKNLGKGGGFRTGIKAAKGEVIVQIDADCQFLPEEIPKLIEPIVKGEADVTLGSRFVKGAYIEPGSMTIRNRIGNYGASFITALACFRKITDIQAGFKAFKRDALSQLDFRENSFGYEPEVVILAAKKGYRIKEVPITYHIRRKGQSNIAFLRDVYRISKTILRTFIFS